MYTIEYIYEVFPCLLIELSYFFILRALLLIFKTTIVLSLKMIGNRSVRSIHFGIFLVINGFRFQCIFIAYASTFFMLLTVINTCSNCYCFTIFLNSLIYVSSK